MSQILDRQIQRVLAPLVAGTNWGQKFVAERVLRIMNAYGEEFTWEKQGNEGLIDRGNQAKRSLNAPSNSVDPPENATATGKLTEYSLNSPIDLRLINAARVQDQIRSGIAPADGLSAVERLQLGRARMLQHNIQILKEKVVAGLVFGSGNFASGFTASDVGFGASGIIGKVLTAKRKVRQAFGFSPDVLVFGELAWLKLLENTDILDRIKYGGSNQDPAEITEEMIAGVFGVREVIVPTAVSQTLAAPGATGTVTELWTNDSVAMIFSGEPVSDESGESNEIDYASPAFGKLAYMNVPETGVRNLVDSWLSLDGKNEYIQVTEFFEVIQPMKAGYLWTNADQ